MHSAWSSSAPLDFTLIYRVLPFPNFGQTNNRPTEVDKADLLPRSLSPALGPTGKHLEVSRNDDTAV